MRLRKHFEEHAQKSATRRSVQKSQKSSSAAVAGHRAFVPMITGWGAALFGLSVLVLPASMTASMATLAGIGSLGGASKFALAAVAALLGGGLAFIAAAALREGARRHLEKPSVVSAVSSRRVQPIDPVVELGSASLDAPLDAEPFGAEEEDGEFVELPACDDQPTLGELSQRGYEIEAPEDLPTDEYGEEGKPSFTRSRFKTALIETCEGATCEAAPAGQPEPQLEPQKEPTLALQAEDTSAQTRPSGPIGSPQSTNAWSLTQFTPSSSGASEAKKPVALDLSEFAELPGRNAVWVEEETQEPEQKRAPPHAPGTGALEKLRQKPTAELSIVEMVERFAGALHQHQTAQQAAQQLRQHQTQSGKQNSGPGRDAALAEALKALTLFTEGGFDSASPVRTPNPANANGDFSDLGQTERELRDALVKLQALRGAA